MTSWRQSRILASLVVFAFLAVQISLPIQRAVDEDSRRFGWQMYSASDPAPDFVVSTSEGSEEISLADYTPVIRTDVPYAELIPPHLCSAVPDAQRVTWGNGTFEC